MFGARYDPVKSYFAPGPILQASDRATRKFLNNFGAFVRTRAKTSIREIGKRARKQGVNVAPPGAPPFSHKGGLRKFIRFAADKKSVVIGPELLPGKIGHAPSALEEGGLSQAWTGVRNNRRTRETYVRAHPFMLPAFEAELPGVPAMWKDAIK